MTPCLDTGDLQMQQTCHQAEIRPGGERKCQLILKIQLKMGIKDTSLEITFVDSVLFQTHLDLDPGHDFRQLVPLWYTFLTFF